MVDPIAAAMDRTADGLAEAVLSTRASAESIWLVTGRPGLGKSALARALVERLDAEGAKPLLVDPPKRDVDTGAAAMTALGAALRRHGLMNGAFERCLEPERPWGVKLRELKSTMEGARDDFVLVCEEPENWLSPHAVADSLDAHARDIANTLQAIPCRRVFLGRLPEPSYVKGTISLHPPQHPDEWLRDGASWGEYSEVAVRMAAGFGQRLRGMTPLQIRTLLAIAALRSIEEASRILSVGDTRRELALSLRRILRSSGKGRSVVRLWDRVALLRRPFDDRMLGMLCADEPPVPDAKPFTELVLTRVRGALSMHDTFRRDAFQDGTLSKADTVATRGGIARRYQADAGSRPVETAAVDRLEALHHAALAGDVDLVRAIGFYFTDQMNMLGRSLSQDFRRYDEAVDVFRSVTRIDVRDDYAHHYLAYNLDVQGKDHKTVELGYKAAIDLDADNVWWRTRYINFLITRGRTAQARRAWNDALDTVKPGRAATEDFLYLNLHRWVARLLLHRGQLEFAAEVLEDIPGTVKAANPQLTALARLLKSLQAESGVGSVIPPHIPPERWWDGPHLCATKERGGAARERWLPGCVESLDAGEIRILVALPSPGGGEPTFGHVDLRREDFDRYSRDQEARDVEVGRFVEMGFYGADPDPVIRVHPRDREDPDLPPLYPSPTRYLDRR